MYSLRRTAVRLSLLLEELLEGSSLINNMLGSLKLLFNPETNKDNASSPFRQLENFLVPTVSRRHAPILLVLRLLKLLLLLLLSQSASASADGGSHPPSLTSRQGASWSPKRRPGHLCPNSP